VRVRLLVDVETDDLPRLQRYVGEQPVVYLRFEEDRAAPAGPRPWCVTGRFVGASEAVGHRT
jgi:hypothetical protein